MALAGGPSVNFQPSVAVTTFNRSQLLRRAIQSVLDQSWPGLEILVVDDGSTDDTAEMIRSLYPQVNYIRQPVNRGIGAARNRALSEARHPWVAFLDDDDTLLEGALARMALRIAEFSEAEHYPVLQFPRDNGRLAVDFTIARLEDYITDVLQGDFVPVIRRDRFLSEGLAYPEIRSAGEGLLWLHVAEKYGIPTWSDQVASVHHDAPNRITSVEYQLSHASAYAELQERLLGEFGSVLASRFPDYYRKKLLGAATYRLLARDRGAARTHLRSALKKRFSLEAVGLWALSFSPYGWTEKFFRAYRRHNEVANNS